MKQNKIITLLATLCFFTGAANAAGEFVTCNLKTEGAKKTITTIGWLFNDGRLVETAPKTHDGMKVTNKILDYMEPIEFDTKGHEVVDIKNQRVKSLQLIHKDKNGHPLMQVEITLDITYDKYHALGHIDKEPLDDNADCTYKSLDDSKINTSVLDKYKDQLEGINTKYPH